MQQSRLDSLILALVLFTASGASQAASPGSAILLGRSASNPDNTLRSASIFLTNPTGSALRQLTPKVTGVYDFSATWSPHGTRIVFVRGSAGDATDDRYDLYTMDRYGHGIRQVTSGSGNFEGPAWGSLGRIAFRSEYVNRACLSIVDVDGQHQHDLFCPGHQGEDIEGYTWSGDGRALYVSSGYFGGGLDPVWNARAYRVDIDTGAVTLLTAQTMDDPLYLTFAPNGRFGIYADVGYGSRMLRVDFATDTLTPLVDGYAPLFFDDGSKVAFTQRIFEDAPDFLVYDQLFVMNPDGTGVRQLTHARVDELVYSATDWSKDGRRLLVNRTVYVDTGGLFVGTTVMRMLDTETGALTSMPGGYGGEWFEP